MDTSSPGSVAVLQRQSEQSGWTGTPDKGPCCFARIMKTVLLVSIHELFAKVNPRSLAWWEMSGHRWRMFCLREPVQMAWTEHECLRGVQLTGVPSLVGAPESMRSGQSLGERFQHESGPLQLAWLLGLTGVEERLRREPSYDGAKGCDTCQVQSGSLLVGPGSVGPGVLKKKTVDRVLVEVWTTNLLEQHIFCALAVELE